jgi:hypothetical protein
MRTLHVILLLLCSSAPALELHVSRNGNDQNSGARDAPFATMGRALDAAGSHPGGESVAVVIASGAYYLDSTLLIDAGIAGSSAAPLVLRAAPGAEVRLVGGAPVPGAAFAPVNDPAVVARLNESARAHARVADLRALPAFGALALEPFPDQFTAPPIVPELFFNDARMTLARWPNDGWAETASIVESGPAPWRNHESNQKGVLAYAGARPARWTSAPAVWLGGYWCFDWAFDTIRVEAIDVDNKHITLAHKHHYGLGSGNPGPRRFYAINLLEELDAPGEYYLDSENSLLYFWPPSTLEGARIVLSTLQTPVIHVNGASHVTIENLIVEGTAGPGIRIDGGEQNAVVGCTVRNTGKEGIVVEGGTHHRVEGCDVYDTGTAGVAMSGGDRKTLAPSGHEIVNNHIHNISRRQRTHAYNVHMSGVGIRLANNLLTDSPHQSIGLWGNDHLIEYNEIARSGQESDDCGAFYMGRNPSERGNVIRYNYWHDTGSVRGHGSCAVYFDDGTSGQHVYGNVFYKAAGGGFGAVFIHGGHDNLVENNIFIECARPWGHAPWGDAMWKEWVEGDLWRQRLREEVDITSDLYLTRYPALAGFFEPDDKPRTNKALRNVVYRCGTGEKWTGNWEESENWVTEDDPGFVDAAKQDFRLREDAAVFEKITGFEPIAFEQIGPQR